MRNWARARDRRAESRGMLEGTIEGSEDADRRAADASEAVITSSIRGASAVKRNRIGDAKDQSW